MIDSENYFRYKKLKQSADIFYREYDLKGILATDLAMFSFQRKRNISLKLIISSLLFTKDTSHIIETLKEKKVLFTTADYGSDHRQLLEEIMNHVPNSVLLEESNKRKVRFALKIILKSIFEIFSKFKNNNLTLQQKLYFSLRLISYKKFIDELENNAKKVQIIKYVPFLNCLTPDSIYCQFFRLRNIKSYGIQHGQYSSKKYYKTIVPFDVINIENFQADYLLGWGELIKESLVDEGFESEQFILAGNPKYFTRNRIELKKSNFNSCVICLARDFYEEENLQLLKIGVKIQKNNTDVYIKLHPRSDVSNYIQFINENRLMLLDKTISISNIISNYNIDYAIVYNSTVYYEFYLNNLIAFRFAINENDIPIGLEDHFSTFQELSERIEQIKKSDIRNLNERATNIINKFCALGTNNYAQILK